MTTLTTLEWDAAAALVNAARRVLVLTHVDPDGDAFGSMLGLAAALRQLGKDVITAVDGGILPEFRFLPGADQVQPALDGVRVDLTIAVDCGDESRMGAVGRAARACGAPLINLDHHRTNTRFGTANLVDPRTVAAAEGVMDWLLRLGVTIDHPIALCLLTGLVTDTLCFRTDNVTAQTLSKAQVLMAQGVSLAEIVQRTVNWRPLAGLRLWSLALPTVQFEEHVMWAVITQPMFHAAGFASVDDAGLVSLLIQTAGVAVAVVFKEKPDGAVEIGIRAAPGYDTSDIAVQLGGGGHPAASGATVREGLETAVPRVIALFKDLVRRNGPPLS